MTTDEQWKDHVSERLENIESRLTGIEATRGTMKVPIAAWALLWVILLAIVSTATSAAFYAGQLTGTMASLQKQSDANSNEIKEHSLLPGHSGVTERINSIKEEVDRLERRIR